MSRRDTQPNASALVFTHILFDDPCGLLITPRCWAALLPKAGAGSNPVGGGLFIVPAPLARLPNPGGGICSAGRSQAAGWKAGQGTPPGLGRGGSGAGTINRPPLRGFGS